MKIGILNTDVLAQSLVKNHGDYPFMFERLLGAADNSLSFQSWDITRGNFPEELDSCSGYLVTGSKASVYDFDHVPWLGKLESFLQRLHGEKRKVVGICFGHQLVAQALGGKTEKSDKGWGVGVAQARVIRQSPWMAPLLEEYRLLVSHQDQVTRLPPNAQLLASSEFCPNAAFSLEEHILCFQGHPEFTKAYSRDLLGLRREVLGEETYRRALNTLASPVDSPVIAKWITAFFQGAG